MAYFDFKNFILRREFLFFLAQKYEIYHKKTENNK